MGKFGLTVLLVACWATTASAAQVYLNDGSWINAKKVWREKGRVVVLVNRESITSFTNAEVNLRKTFPPRKKRIKPAATVKAAPTAPVPVAAAAPVQPSAQSQPAGKKFSMPSLPTKLPEREPPKASEEGALRKQKREMQQRLNE